MPEHTIPNSLVENIRQGRAAIVVGAGIGVPSWKQLLESMNEELRSRGQEGDEAAAKDVDKLLHKGNLVRAAAFLGRQLGSDVCDEVVQNTWGDLSGTPEIAQTIATLPVRQLWTTFPGTVLEEALRENLPDDWPSALVYTYRQAGSIDPKRRTLLKVLGDFDSFIATPKSIRKALASADDLRDFIRPFYAEGSLIFVGFRYGDPDLSALLDRVFGSFEPTDSEHYLLSSAVGPVTVDELESDHRLTVVNLPGKGNDDEAMASMVSYLSSLKNACEEAEISLAKSRPEANDLEGWLTLLEEDSYDKDALDALATIEASARDSGDFERVIEVLMARTELETDAAARASHLAKVAEIFADELDDKAGAFTALSAALRLAPDNDELYERCSKLADELKEWAELTGDLAALTGEIEDRKLQARYYARLGYAYHKKLSHTDYAIASYREALRRDSELDDAYKGLADALRVQARWGELAELIDTQVDRASDAEEKLDLYLALGDLCESQLAARPRAIDAYESAIDLETEVEDAYVALERLYRQSEHWGKLAKVLERKASYLGERGASGQADAARKEAETLRSDKLGDLEGSLSKHEKALADNPEDLEALKALRDSYDKLGRSDDYLRVLTTLSDVAPDSERPGYLRQLAMELEEREDGREKAIFALSSLIELDRQADDAYRSLERLHREGEEWDELAQVLESHVMVQGDVQKRADLYLELAKVYEERLSDPHRAREALEHVIADTPDNQDATASLARLYQRTEDWQKAVDMFASHAEGQGKAGGAHFAQAGTIAYEHLDDSETARQYLEKALELSPHSVEALRTLVRLHKSQGAWESAVNRLVDASEASANRLEQVEFLLDAVSLSDDNLGDRKRSLSLLRRVLEIDPENLDAGQRLAERLVARKRFEEAFPVLEMVARRSDPDDRLERVENYLELGRIGLQVGELEKAEDYLAKAVELNPSNLDAALAMAEAMFGRAEKVNDAERWQDVDKRFRGILARHRTGLADSQVVELWYRLAQVGLHLGEIGKAEAALRRALEREPGHEASLRELVAIAKSKGDFKSMVAAKRELLDSLEGEDKALALEEIGDLYRSELSDPGLALGAYLEATKTRPNDRSLLHKTLEVLTQQKEWRQAVQILDALSSSESSQKKRAKYHYAAAVICRDEIGDTELAVDFFTRALDDNPGTHKAFDAIDRLLSSKGEWKSLAQSHRKMLKSVGQDAPDELQLKLWGRLGDICADHLDDSAAAQTALEVAISLDPSDMTRREKLVDIYLDGGNAPHKAIAELQVLISADPDRVELYRVLSDQYQQLGEVDKAYCVAQALVFLKAANSEEKALYEKGRPQAFLAAKRRITEELWQKAVIHQRENRHVNAIFSSVLGPLAATTAQPLEAFNVKGEFASTGDQTISKVFRYASSVLGLSPEPELVVEADKESGLRVANTVAADKLKPTLVAGSPHATAGSEAELAFELGKRMAYMRPERYLNYALQTLPKLEGAFYAALEAAGNELGKGHSDSEMTATLKSQVPKAVLEQIGAVAEKMEIDAQNGVIAGWQSATDLTANRVGFILCNDLVVAARAIATEKSANSSLSAKERLRDLLAYSVSEDYFSVRQHLGLGLETQ